MGPEATQLAKWRAQPHIMVRELFGAEPDPWQDDALAAFPTTPRIAMKASKGPGKLQPKSMVLDTPFGVKRWGDLRVGDYVFAPDGTPTRITATHDNGVIGQYRVTFDDGSSTLCGGEHLWRVRGAAERSRKCLKPYRRETRTANVWAVLTTEEILSRGVRVKNGRWSGRQFEIPRHEAVQYPRVAQPMDPYVLGVWLGDGAKETARYTGIDREVEREIVRRGYRIGGETPDGQTRTIYGLGAYLRELGVFSLGSHERYVPDLYRFAAPQQRADVLAGLLDTDGCIGDDGHMEFDSTSRQLAMDVVWLVRSLGGVAYFKQTVKKPWYYSKERERIAGRDCHRVTVRTPFNPFKIGRKAERWSAPDNKSKARYLTRYIDRIDPAPAEDSMCIEVDHPSKCYLANDFIVTHNSTVLAWLGWNYLLTRPHPNISATSISGDNLRDNLWKEMAVWRNKSELLKSLFEWQTERIFFKGHPATWWMSARSWSRTADKEQLGNTLAGLHSKHVMALMDESGSMPTAIMASAEGIFAGSEEAHIVQAGNTNSLDGALYEACVKQKHLWKVIVISGDPDDPKRSSRVSIEWAKEMIAAHGRDSPFIKVLLLGEWPKASINALLGPEDVERAMSRIYQEHDIAHAARILGVDVARQGDDASVIYPRQGLVAFKPQVLRNVTGIVGGGQVARVWTDWKVDAVFIDNTGGFGASWIDVLSTLNRSAIPVGFAEHATDRRYYNRRAEMYFKLAQWIKDGGALLNAPPQIVGELTQTTYSFKGDALLLEPKEMIKVKLGRSPDIADALALTFAEPVASRMVQEVLPRRQQENNYDVFAEYLGR